MPAEFAEREFNEYLIAIPRRSFRLCAREVHYLGPLLRLFSDELPEVSGRASKCGTAHVSELRLDPRIGEGRVDLLVELIDYFDGRVSWCAYAHAEACLIARHKIGHRRDVRQRC